MTVDEKLAVIARALLILSAKAARTWDYDGETMVGEGVSLDPDIEAALEQIASILTDRRNVDRGGRTMKSLWSEGGTRL